jgi:serine/threonine-protein kinase
MIGKTLSHYRIVEKVGAGGMGEVYRARDERLERDVALKVLPAGTLADEQARKRFRKEALTLSKLNHPHIATIFDFDTHDGVDFLAMEHVAGETLADRLTQASLPEKEIARLGAQIADALQEAHEQGVVHRDLKPGNIKLTAKGQAKILDFGIAKLLKPVQEATTKSFTGTQALAGTLPYMSPEQLRADPVDARSDLYSFGVVLYEMATGQRPFQQKLSTALSDAILHELPPVPRTLNHRLSPVLENTLLKCLEKEPDSRYQSAKELAVDLRRLGAPQAARVVAQAPAGDQKPIATAAPPAGRQWVVPWVVAGILAAALIAVLFVPREPVEPLGGSARLSINLPAEAPLAPASAMPLGVGRSSLALSPEGSLLVYVAFVDGQTKLYLREMHRGEFHEIPGTEDAHSPFFSPDGKWVGFFAHDKLKKVPLAGGEPIPLCNATLGFGGSWAHDDTIYFSTDYGSGINKVGAAGGRPEVVTVRDRGTPHFFPHILPGGKGVLFSVEWGAIGVHDLQTGQRKFLLRQGTFPHYSSTGHIIFAGRGTIQAAPFDLDSLELTGPPVVLVEGVRSERDGAAQFAFALDGTLMFGSEQMPHRVRWCGLTAGETPAPWGPQQATTTASGSLPTEKRLQSLLWVRPGATSGCMTFSAAPRRV